MSATKPLTLNGCEGKRRRRGSLPSPPHFYGCDHQNRQSRPHGAKLIRSGSSGHVWEAQVE